jgi:hypothetical protein
MIGLIPSRTALSLETPGSGGSGMHDFTGFYRISSAFFGILSGHNFNDAQVRTCWRHFVESEIGLTQEAIVLFLRSFMT